MTFIKSILIIQIAMFGGYIILSASILLIQTLVNKLIKKNLK